MLSFCLKFQKFPIQACSWLASFTIIQIKPIKSIFKGFVTTILSYKDFNIAIGTLDQNVEVSLPTTYWPKSCNRPPSV